MSLMRNPSGGSLEAAVAAISTGIYSKGGGREGKGGGSIHLGSVKITQS